MTKRESSHCMWTSIFRPGWLRAITYQWSGWLVVPQYESFVKTWMSWLWSTVSDRHQLLLVKHWLCHIYSHVWPCVWCLKETKGHQPDVQEWATTPQFETYCWCLFLYYSHSVNYAGLVTGLSQTRGQWCRKRHVGLTLVGNYYWWWNNVITLKWIIVKPTTFLFNLLFFFY